MDLKKDRRIENGEDDLLKNFNIYVSKAVFYEGNYEKNKTTGNVWRKNDTMIKSKIKRNR